MYSVESRPIWPIGTSFVLFEACICRSDVPAPDSYALGGLTRTRTLMVTSFFVASGYFGKYSTTKKLGKSGQADRLG